MSTTLLTQAAGAMIILAVGAIILGFIRRKLVPKTRILAAFVSVTVATAAVVASATFAGIDLFGTPTWLMLGAFLGLLWVQPDPWAVRAFLRALSLVSGVVAFYSALASNLVAVALALGLTGVLLKLSGTEKTNSGEGGNAT